MSLLNYYHFISFILFIYLGKYADEQMQKGYINVSRLWES